MRVINKIVLHHSATPRDLEFKNSIISFNNSHQVRLHPKKNSLGYHIAYHYVIGSNGEVLQTRGHNEIGFHASNWLVNCASLGICLTGNFDIEKPSLKQMEALINLFAKLKIKNIKGHRAYAKKTCPGLNFTDRMIAEATYNMIDKNMVFIN